MRDALLLERLKAALPQADFASVRWVRSRSESLAVRQDVLQPSQGTVDEGVMFTVHHRGGLGYGATCDLTPSGLKTAAETACHWARASADKAVFDFSALTLPAPRGEYQTPVRIPWDAVPLQAKMARLLAVSRQLKISPRIVDWQCSVHVVETQTCYVTAHGGEVWQDFASIVPDLSATANDGADTVTRSLGRALGRRGGLELLDAIGFDKAPRPVAEEALDLLAAPNCPSGRMDLLLAPDQVYLQVHESIGHPLELDRILGDERNFAGTSFVTLDMFGSYRYGSPLLTVTYDPTDPGEMASFGWDDDGARAEKTCLIREGVLQRPVGGALSQARAGIPGVATARACSWNRPPVDRMSNLNLEPGASTFDDMVRGIEDGIYMQTNCSWSIDDSRNKFQFGCEVGRLIRDGRLAEKVKKPNYRGVSAEFWRSLRMVGDHSTFQVMGTPNCGKAEPNQLIQVGHAAPACLFTGVDVFGGEA